MVIGNFLVNTKYQILSLSLSLFLFPSILLVASGRNATQMSFSKKEYLFVVTTRKSRDRIAFSYSWI